MLQLLQQGWRRQPPLLLLQKIEGLIFSLQQLAASALLWLGCNCNQAGDRISVVVREHFASKGKSNVCVVCIVVMADALAQANESQSICQAGRLFQTNATGPRASCVAPAYLII